MLFRRSLRAVPQNFSCKKQPNDGRSEQGDPIDQREREIRLGVWPIAPDDVVGVHCGRLLVLVGSDRVKLLSRELDEWRVASELFSL